MSPEQMVIADALGSSELIDTNELTRRIVAFRVLDALRSSGYAVIALPEPTGSKDGDDDENGFVEWDYPHGSVQVFDDGVIGWHQWHFEDPSKLHAAAAALIAAAHRAEQESRK